MSTLPEMRPSAERRTAHALGWVVLPDPVSILPRQQEMIDGTLAAINDAFRDGVAVGDKRAVERIAALLRAEADAQFDLAPGFVIEHAQAICTTLRSIADRIESEGKDAP